MITTIKIMLPIIESKRNSNNLICITIRIIIFLKIILISLHLERSIKFLTHNQMILPRCYDYKNRKNKIKMLNYIFKAPTPMLIMMVIWDLMTKKFIIHLKSLKVIKLEHYIILIIWMERHTIPTILIQED